jgi:hypothetical protein
MNITYLRFLRYIRVYFDGRPIDYAFWRRQFLAWGRTASAAPSSTTPPPSA